MLFPELPGLGPKELQRAIEFSGCAGEMRSEQLVAEEPYSSKLQLATPQIRCYCSLGTFA